jgi:hypothetical protein
MIRRNAMLQFHRRIALVAALALLAPSLCADRALAGAPEQAAPQGEDPPGADDNNAVTPPPAKHDGVITPPPIGDEGIHAEVPNPDAGHDEEVIPPPGTPDGDPNVIPH